MVLHLLLLCRRHITPLSPRKVCQGAALIFSGFHLQLRYGCGLQQWHAIQNLLLGL